MEHQKAKRISIPKSRLGAVWEQRTNLFMIHKRSGEIHETPDEDGQQVDQVEMECDMLTVKWLDEGSQGRWEDNWHNGKKSIDDNTG